MSEEKMAEEKIAEKKIADGSIAEAVVRRQLESEHGDKLKSVSFRKTWLSAAAAQQYWEVEGSFKYKKGMLRKETRNFRYQINPDNGAIIGREEITPK